MDFRLKPKEEKFFKFLSDHATIARQSAELLEKSIHGKSRIYDAVSEIDELEKRADDIVVGTTRKLNKMFITPIDREDIHILIEKQDDIIDSIKGVIEKMHMYNVGPATDGMKELANVVFKCVKQLDKAVANLDNLKKNHLKLEARCNRIVVLEADGDQLYRREMAKLFRENTNPIEIIKKKEVLSEMEEILDLCEEIAESLKRVVLKYA
jgi:predicted phosphate transport protein (TIGR00153 family)